MFKSIRHGILACLVGLLGCGGGSNSVPTLSIYGDSYTATDPSTAMQLEVFSNHTMYVTSYSVGGATTEHARTGAAPNPMPFINFKVQMESTDSSKYIALRYGIAEIFFQPSVTVFERNLREFVTQIRENNKVPLLVNMVSLPLTDVVTVDVKLKLDSYNSTIEYVSRDMKVSLVDIRSVVNFTPDKMYEDGLHPTPEMTKEINKLLAIEFLKVVK